MLKKSHGFTIVELLIVIVVIGILAAITIVSFSGIQDRAHDVRRKSDLATISKTILINNTQNGQQSLRQNSGCGAYGNGSGWWHTEEDFYPKTVRTCLVEAGFHQVANIIDPSGCEGGGTTACPSPRYRYMVLACELNGVDVGYVLGRLATEPADTTTTDNLCTDIYGDSGFTPGSVANWDTVYHINYVTRIY